MRSQGAVATCRLHRHRYVFAPLSWTVGRKLTRFLGVADIGFAVLTWGLRDAQQPETLWTIFTGLFLRDTLGFGAGLFGMLPGAGDRLRWHIVAMYLPLARGHGYFRLVVPSPR